MAFICVLDHPDNDELSVMGNGTELLVSLPIGYDDETGDAYNIVNTLSPYPGHSPDGFEQAFFISEKPADVDGVYSIYDGLDSKNKLGGVIERAKILKAILTTTEFLIDTVKPKMVAMSTMRPLPEKALRKYRLVLGVYEAKGYETGETDPYNGLRFFAAVKHDQ